MVSRLAARLAVLVLVALSLEAPSFAGDPVVPVVPVVLAKPQPLRATLADGRAIAGSVARWDDDGFEGQIGRYRWTDFKSAEAYRVRKRLIEAEGGDRRARMLELSAWCLSVDDGAPLAERAWKDAQATVEERAESKLRGAELRRNRDEKARAAEKEKLRTGSPEGADFPPDRWQPADSARFAAEMQALRKEVQGKIAAAGRDLAPAEADQCLVYSDLGAADAAQRAMDIDEFVTASAPRLGLPKEARLFEGKLVVIIADGEDRFRVLEAAAFHQAAGPADQSFAHYSPDGQGGRAFVVVRKQTEEVATKLATYRAVALAILHRHISARRLPPWANEGVADWLVSVFPRGKSLDTTLRTPALAFLRKGGSLESVMELTYEEDSWPGPQGIGRPVGFLLVSFMAEANPTRFRAFVAAVKGGKDWPKALADDYGLAPANFLEAARAHYRTND